MGGLRSMCTFYLEVSMVDSVGRSGVRRALRAALGDFNLALCMHRALPFVTRPSRANLSIAPGKFDDLLDLLLSSRPNAPRGWLTVAFDDGYLDAAEYVATRATTYPDVEFVMFVCPEKTEGGVGFRWDGPDDDRALIDAPIDLLTENQREDLRQIGRSPESRVAPLAQVRALTAFPNVTIGNHTNTHIAATRLSADQVQLEYTRSFEAFERLFGPAKQFAFPYGTPFVSFNREHVRLLRAVCPESVYWSTEPRPYLPAERVPGAVLPRMAIDGTRSVWQLAAWITKRALVYRLKGPKFVMDEPASLPQGEGLAAPAEASASVTPISSEGAAAER